MLRRDFLASGVLAATAALTSSSLLSGCGDRSAASTPSARGNGSAAHPKGRLLVILLDETASFRHNPDQWGLSVEKASQIVRELYPGDAALVVGIDDKSWGDDDIRVPYTTLPYSALAAVATKARLIKQIRELQPRSASSGFIVNGHPRNKPPGTDLYGSLDYCCFLAQGAQNRAVSVVVFTDLEDEPRAETARRSPAPFPRFTHLTFLNIRQHTGVGVQKRIAEWMIRVDALRFPGAPPLCTEDDFKLIGQADQVTRFFAFAR